MAGRFATTRWSVVLAARGTGVEARAALEALCRAYWHNVYAFVRRSGHRHERALDLTQEFFARIIARHDVGRLDPNRGRFRAWLCRAIKNFLANAHDEDTALKRDMRKVVWLDSLGAEERYRLEPWDDLDPERAFDHAWALQLLERCYQRLEAECEAKGKARLFGHVKAFLAHAPCSGDYEVVAQALRVDTNYVKQQVSRMRERWSLLVHAEIADLVEDAADVPAEIEHLLRALNPRKDHGSNSVPHLR